MLTELEMENCATAPSFGHLVSCALVFWLSPLRDRAGTDFCSLSWLQWKIVQMSAFCDQEPSWQHISFHSMLNNCRLSSGFVLCLSLAVGVWSWRETKGHFCILIYWNYFTALVGLYFITICFELVRCWPMGMFYWTLCSKLKPNSLVCSWAQLDDNALTDKPGICSFN